MQPVNVSSSLQMYGLNLPRSRLSFIAAFMRGANAKFPNRKKRTKQGRRSKICFSTLGEKVKAQVCTRETRGVEMSSFILTAGF